MAMVEGAYQGNAIADYFNQVLRDTLRAYMESRLSGEPDAKIRILEIGAGTGGTTASVFGVLQAYGERVAEYCYTDVSNAFLLHGQARYGQQIPYLIRTIFDVTTPIGPQGIAADHYDIAIAANVLHATPNIRESVRNAKAALAERDQSQHAVPSPDVRPVEGVVGLRGCGPSDSRLPGLIVRELVACIERRGL
jgi:polyketide synthase PksR